MMLIFPSSPIWADISREPMWSEEVFWYDSGVRQASSPWERPLYRYGINAKNFNEVKQSALHTFVNSLKNRVNPFLIKDPYDYEVNSIVQPTSSNMNSGDGFYFVNDRDWRVIPDSAFLYVSDPSSGQLLPGSHFVMSQDNGFCSILVGVASIWVSSFEYFRKAAFEDAYVERSSIWNNFSTARIIREIPPDR